MLNLWIMGAVAVAAKKYGEHVAEKRIMAEAEKEERALPQGATYAKSPPPQEAQRPPMFSPEAREMLLVSIGTGQNAFRPNQTERLEKRLANCSLEPSELNDVDYTTGLRTYKLVPLTPPNAAGSRSALDEVLEAVSKGGVAYCSLTCILSDGERVVALHPSEMVVPIRLNPHFAKLQISPDVPAEVVAHVEAIAGKVPKVTSRKAVVQSPPEVSRTPVPPVRREDVSSPPALTNGAPKIDEILAAREQEQREEAMAVADKAKAR